MAPRFLDSLLSLSIPVTGMGLSLLPNNLEALGTPGLTVALALVAGITAVSLARHIRLPGIVLLLFAGVILGPDGVNIVRPATLGHGLHTLVGFAVAIILFEGGMSLSFRRLRTEGRAIRQLITLGALVTLGGATLAARIFLGWPWRICFLFGTLVIVTGPTVIQPLLRRIRVQRPVATVLEAEGVLIDAVGAIVAAVALEVALAPSGEMAARGALSIVMRLAFGALVGLLAGYLMARLLRIRGLVPSGLENVFVLSLVVALFKLSNGLLEESGIAVVTVAGIIVGNSKTHVRRELQEFKEQLTVMFIGMLFILLAADVRIAEVQQLGTSALLVVAALMFVVRPLNIFIGTVGTALNWRQKVFMSWIGPRGIVAAAVAAFFVTDLEEHGITGAKPLQALVFLVIGATVLSAGLTGGLVARILRVRGKQDDGWVIMGANPLARAVASDLKRGGEDVVLIEAEADELNNAQKAGLRVIFGDALDEGVLARAGIDSRAGAIALTGSDEANGVFLQTVHRQAKLKRLLGVLRNDDKKKHLFEGIEGHVLFGSTRDVDVWSSRIRKKDVREARFVFQGPDGVKLTPIPPVNLPTESGETDVPASGMPRPETHVFKPPQGLYVLLTRQREKKIEPIADNTRFKKGDNVTLLVNREREAEAEDHLLAAGFVPVSGAAQQTS